MAALHPARPRDGISLEPLHGRRDSARGWHLAAFTGAVVSGAVLGVCMADVGVAILRSLLLLAALIGVTVTFKHRYRDN